MRSLLRTPFPSPARRLAGNLRLVQRFSKLATHNQTGGRKLKFAFMNLKEHARGNLILQRLVESGFEPSVVIEEESKMSITDCPKLDEELSKLNPHEYPLPLSTERIMAKTGINHVVVRDHNDRQTVDALQAANVDLVVLGDCRVLKPHIINIPSEGVINTHPGYLPEVRGNHCSLYAIIHDLPVGCTVHYVDKGVDTGSIIEKLRFKDVSLKGTCSEKESSNLYLEWTKMTYPRLLWYLNESCANLAVEAISRIQEGTVQRWPQYPRNIHPFGTFKALPDRMKIQAIKKLEAGCFWGGSLNPMHLRDPYATPQKYEIQDIREYTEAEETMKATG